MSFPNTLVDPNQNRFKHADGVPFGYIFLKFLYVATCNLKNILYGRSADACDIFS